jgi:hypothetical protein
VLVGSTFRTEFAIVVVVLTEQASGRIVAADSVLVAETKVAVAILEMGVVRAN